MSVKFPKIKWSWSGNLSNPNIIDYGYDWLKDQYKDWTGTKGLEEQNQRDYELGLKQLELLDQQNKETNSISRENIDMQKDIAMQNFGLQQSQFDYQKRLNQLTMEREDNSIQRQVADLQAAGLSPLMAAGGASSSNLSSAPAPQIDTSGISAAQGSYLSLAQQYSALKQETMSNIRSNSSKNAQAIASNKQGAAFALANLVKGAAMDLNESYWKAQNYRMQVERQEAELNRINEQIESSKQEREWMKTHGYRNQDIMNVIIPMLENYFSGKSLNEVIEDAKKQLQEITNNGMIQAGKAEITNIIENAADNVHDFGKSIQENIQNAVDNVQPITVNSKGSATSRQIEQAVENYQNKQFAKKSKQQIKQINYVSEKMLEHAASNLNIPNYSTIRYKIKKDKNGKPFIQFYDMYKIKPISDKMYTPEAVRKEYERVSHLGN